MEYRVKVTEGTVSYLLPDKFLSSNTAQVAGDCQIQLMEEDSIKGTYEIIVDAQ